ncbi:HlyD family secretion protein [Novipirellula galeiformis]|uniref:HlyD family secretion protein n=1 Tax=Novipirellula galeiformis TaxID=2528004 RepID=A0A5C6CHB5_9BACT|nr:HlyD family secretion protein [Novipirellula galeiformis]
MVKTAIDRRLGVRMRGGLTSVESWTRAGRVWILSDPLVRQYFYLLDEEYELLRLLDEDASVANVRQRFETGHVRRRLDPARLIALIARWHREGLVESLSPNQATMLADLGAEERRRRWQQQWLNPLVIRLPGFDPAWILGRIAPHVAWFFSPIMVLFSVLLMCSAILLVTTQFATLRASLPSLDMLAQPNQWFVLLGVAAGIKILHEFGHALVCRRFGIQVKEMGVLLMLLMPCLYCDVSDAWRLPQRRHRMFISAAGIYVELVLAAAATWLWWWSQPGLFHTVCLNVMLIGSVNTVLLNGNPLLRYDGYYLLSDGLGIFNLWSRSRAAVRSAIERLLLGIVSDGDPMDDRFTRLFLIVYGIASIAYRYLVLGFMLLFLHAMLKPLGLEWLAMVGGVWLVATSVIFPARRQLQRRFSPSGRRGVASRNVILSAVGLGLLLIVFFFLPLPNWMTVPAIVQPSPAVDVYVATGGRLVEVNRKYGDPVQRGDLIARLENPELKIEQMQVRGEWERAVAWLEHLESLGATDPATRSMIPAAIARRDDLGRQVQQLADQLHALRLFATTSGVVLPVTRDINETVEEELPEWDDQPLDPQNQNAFLATGTRICTIGSGKQWQMMAFVPQEEIVELQPGLAVRLRLVHLPGEVFDGEVESIASANAKSIPRQLQDSVTLSPGSSTAHVGTRPLGSLYEVRVKIDAETADLWVDARGKARIWLPRRTAFELTRRLLNQTFAL